MTTEKPEVAVLASARIATDLTDALRCTYRVRCWHLPDDCSPVNAAEVARIAATAGAWKNTFGTATVVVTAVDERLLGAVAPHLVRAMRPAGIWLQLGPADDDQIRQHVAQARRDDIAAFNAPLDWSSGAGAVPGSLPYPTTADLDAWAEAHMVYTHALTAWTRRPRPGTG